MESDGDGNLSAPETRRRRQHLVHKQLHGRCASCRGGLSVDTARVRVREVYVHIGDRGPLDDGDEELGERNVLELRVAYAQCVSCFGPAERGPRADGYTLDTPLDAAFFARFRRQGRDGRGPLE